jgi:hypothetical protein
MSANSKSRYVSALGFNLPENEVDPEITKLPCTFGEFAGALPPGYPGTDVDCQCKECRPGREHFGEYIHGSVPIGEYGVRPAAWLIAGMFDGMMTLALNYDRSDVINGVQQFRRHGHCDFEEYAGNPAAAGGRQLMAGFLADFLESFVVEWQKDIHNKQ